MVQTLSRPGTSPNLNISNIFFLPVQLLFSLWRREFSLSGYGVWAHPWRVTYYFWQRWLCAPCCPSTLGITQRRVSKQGGRVHCYRHRRSSTVGSSCKCVRMNAFVFCKGIENHGKNGQLMVQGTWREMSACRCLSVLISITDSTDPGCDLGP